MLMNILYQKSLDGKVTLHNPTQVLLNYLSIGNVFLPEDTFSLGEEGVGTDTTAGASDKTLNLNVDDPFKMNEEEQTLSATFENTIAPPVTNVEVPTSSTINETANSLPTNNDGITYTKIISAPSEQSINPQEQVQSVEQPQVQTQVQTPQIEIPRAFDDTIINNVSDTL